MVLGSLCRGAVGCAHVAALACAPHSPVGCRLARRASLSLSTARLGLTYAYAYALLLLLDLAGFGWIWLDFCWIRLDFGSIRVLGALTALSGGPREAGRSILQSIVHFITSVIVWSFYELVGTS